LRTGGYLILGQSESIGSASDLFAPVDAKFRLFIRRSVPHRLPPPVSRPLTFSHETATGSSEPPNLVLDGLQGVVLFGWKGVSPAPGPGDRDFATKVAFLFTLALERHEK